LADLALDFGLRLCVHLELRSRRFYLAGLQRLSVQSANVECNLAPCAEGTLASVAITS
jgi:hypothetical protein